MLRRMWNFVRTKVEEEYYPSVDLIFGPSGCVITDTRGYGLELEIILYQKLPDYVPKFLNSFGKMEVVQQKSSLYGKFSEDPGFNVWQLYDCDVKIVEEEKILEVTPAPHDWITSVRKTKYTVVADKVETIWRGEKTIGEIGPWTGQEFDLMDLRCFYRGKVEETIINGRLLGVYNGKVNTVRRDPFTVVFIPVESQVFYVRKEPTYWYGKKVEPETINIYGVKKPKR